ncbi:hypothetical protein MKW98_010177 [Papaver atlanticum]|uniref:Uncharacterized protein n=1 Tax=Papaver atlanticum TaxID=357466 RepID=A0AAD4RY03_9MAGN|nr:hypothetical protein MKW98_010177 [Papaver atlanticum]
MVRGDQSTKSLFLQVDNSEIKSSLRFKENHGVGVLYRVIASAGTGVRSLVRKRGIELTGKRCYIYSLLYLRGKGVRIAAFIS